MFILETGSIIFLISAAFVTSTISGFVGMGGGTLLLLVMADFLPPLVLVPLHGFVQLFSNLSRSIINYTNISYKIVGFFLSGALLGGIIGSNFLTIISENKFQLFLACGILLLTWLPKNKIQINFLGKFFFIGFFAQFLSLFIGAIGPFIAPFYLHDNLNKNQIIATKASCQAGTHIFKLTIYFLTGFSIGQYLPLMILMVLAVTLGNYLGKQILTKISEKRFKLIFQLLITGLAVRMLARAINS